MPYLHPELEAGTKKNNIKEESKGFQCKYLLANTKSNGLVWDHFKCDFELRDNPNFLKELGFDFSKLFYSIPSDYEINTRLIVISVFDKYSEANPKFVVIFSMHKIEDEIQNDSKMAYIGYISEGDNPRYIPVGKDRDIKYPFFVEYFDAKRPKDQKGKILDVWDLLHRPKKIDIPILFTNDESIIDIKDHHELSSPLCIVFTDSKTIQSYYSLHVYLPGSDDPCCLHDIWPEIKGGDEKSEEAGWRIEYKRKVEGTEQIFDTFYHANIFHYIDAYSYRKSEGCPKGNTYIIEIPITLHSTSDPALHSTSDRVLFQTVANLSITLEDIDEKPDKKRKIIDAINFYYQLFRVSINEVVSLPIKNRVLDLTRKNSFRSATAGIIARNMSHHLGSHVLPRMGVNDICNRIVTLFKLKKHGKTGRDWDMTVYPMLMNIKDKLDRYLQRKAEFIADFTADPLSTTNSVWLFKDIVFPFLRNTALMDALAANEGFTYKAYDQPGIVIRCFREIKSEELVELFPYFPKYSNNQEVPGWVPIPFGERNITNSREDSIVNFVNIENDVKIVIHGVGEMALYGIFENIIRNTAKYKAASDTRTTIDLWFVLRDDKKNNNLCTIDIYENLSYPEKALIKLVKFLDQEYVNDIGERRTAAWGIAEMEICADILRGIDPIIAKSHNLKINISSPSLPSAPGKEKTYLTYSFDIIKATVAIFFGFENVDEEVIKKLEPAGILFEKSETLKDSKYKTDSRLKGCQFVVIHKSIAVDIDKDLYWLPFRIIIAGKQEFLDINNNRPYIIVDEEPPFLNCSDENENLFGSTMFWLWRNWLKYLSPSIRGEKNALNTGGNIGLDVFFEEDKTNEPTKTWIRGANLYNSAISKDSVPVGIRVWGRKSSGDKSVKLFTEYDRFETGTKRIIVDRHSKFIAESGCSIGSPDKIFFVDKKNPDFDTLYNPRFTDLGNWQLPFEILEAGLINILVIDERIAKTAIRTYEDVSAEKEEFKTYITGYKSGVARILDVAKKAGVFVATHIGIKKSGDSKKVFSLLDQKWLNPISTTSFKDSENIYPLHINFNLEKHKNTNDINKPIKHSMTICYTDVANKSHFLFDELGFKIHLVIIHQGVIDQIFSEVFNSEDRALFVDKLQEDNRWLIIETGRSITPYVRASPYKFISFSTLERAFHGGRIAKFLLSQNVMALSRNNPRGK